MPGPLVKPFSETSFRESFACETVRLGDLRRNRRISYLFEYLSRMRACTLVLEEDYVDRDYAEDFAAYYARCFTSYPRRCKRIHLFAASFDRGTLDRVIMSPERRPELGTYLGFVVARPLAYAPVGRTAVKTYDDDSQRRHYRSIVPCAVDLCGIDLNVESLPFQEQDRVVAACATVALWSALQKTKSLFGSGAPTPAVITRLATQFLQHTRPIPSRGLNVQQICNAIQQLGLEAEVIEIKESTPILSALYAYLAFGVPVILLADLDLERERHHALTVAGYSVRLDARAVNSERRLNEENLEKAEASRLPSRALRIDQLYAHDDQIGPFSRLIVRLPAGKEASRSHVVLESRAAEEPARRIPYYPSVLIVPVYAKVRVSFSDVYDLLLRLNPLLALVLPDYFQGEWDLRLTGNSELKRHIRDSRSYPIVTVKKLLVAHHPRFIWHATFHMSDGKIALDLLVDATGAARDAPVYELIWLDEECRQRAERRLRDFGQRVADVLNVRLYELLVSRTTRKSSER